MIPSRPNVTFLTGLLLGSSLAGLFAFHLITQLLVLVVLVPGFVTPWFLVVPDVFLPSSGQVPLWALFLTLVSLLIYLILVLRSSWRRPPHAVVGYGLFLGALACVLLDRILYDHTLSLAYLVTDGFLGRLPLNVPLLAMIAGSVLLCVSNLSCPDQKSRQDILADLRRSCGFLRRLLTRGACAFSWSSSR